MYVVYHRKYHIIALYTFAFTSDFHVTKYVTISLNHLP